MLAVTTWILAAALADAQTYSYSYTTEAPTLTPTASLAPTRTETYAPSRVTEAPSYAPTTETYGPTAAPTITATPTAAPTCNASCPPDILAVPTSMCPEDATDILPCDACDVTFRPGDLCVSNKTTCPLAPANNCTARFLSGRRRLRGASDEEVQTLVYCFPEESGPAPQPTAGPTSRTSTSTRTPPVEPSTAGPSAMPTSQPTAAPTAKPTAKPSAAPTLEPTTGPTAEPTSHPTAAPSAASSAEPTAGPTAEPTAEPTADPTTRPTAGPTAEPTSGPTAEPTAEPTARPTPAPTAVPSSVPTQAEHYFNRVATFPVCLQYDDTCNTDVATRAEDLSLSPSGQWAAYRDERDVKSIGFVNITDLEAPRAAGLLILEDHTDIIGLKSVAFYSDEIVLAVIDTSNASFASDDDAVRENARGQSGQLLVVELNTPGNLWDSCTWIRSNFNTDGEIVLGPDGDIVTRVATTPDECVALVKEHCPSWDIANLREVGWAKTGCWCQNGTTLPFEKGTDYRSCFVNETVSPTAPPPSIYHTMKLDAQPMHLAVSPDKKYVVIAIEAYHDATPGSVVVVNSSAADPAAWTNRTVSVTGLDGCLTPEDPEPETVAINAENVAVVTLMDNNCFVVIDLKSATVVKSFSAGNVTLARVDVVDDNVINMTGVLQESKRHPDGVAWLDSTTFVSADEGRYTEDGESGGRGITIWDAASGTSIYSSGNLLDHAVARVGLYPEERSERHGIEAEQVAVCKYRHTTYIIATLYYGNAVAVFDATNVSAPVLTQLLPVAVEPKFVACHDTFFVVSSEDDDRDDHIRSSLTLYRYEAEEPMFPTLVSVDDPQNPGVPIPFGLLSSLAAGAGSTLYTAEDGDFRKSRIFTIDVATKPARLTEAVRIVDTDGVFRAALGSYSYDYRLDVEDLINGDATVNLDPEGLAYDGANDRWVVASEGSGDATDDDGFDSLNWLLEVSTSGVIESVVTLPHAVNMMQSSGKGFEGVAIDNAGNYVVGFERRWGAEPYPRIGIYTPSTGSWAFFWYRIEGYGDGHLRFEVNIYLADIASTSQPGVFLAIENDNQGGPDAAVKRVFAFNASAVEARAEPPFEVVNKAFVLDVMPAVRAHNGLMPESFAGLAVLNEDVWVVNDNGLSGSANTSPLGEILLLNVGKFSGLSHSDFTFAPTYAPTGAPTGAPTAEPTAEPTSEPTAKPTAEPTAEPTAAPTAAPTVAPTVSPLVAVDGEGANGIRTAVALWFSDETAAVATYGHISNWDTGAVTDMSELFCAQFFCENFFNPAAENFDEDISAWDISGVTTMDGMLYGASSFNHDLGWCISASVAVSNMLTGAGCASSTSCGVTFDCPCSHTDSTCPAGALCPGGTAVSEQCTSPPGDGTTLGNPCACTALQALVSMSTTLSSTSPWDDFESNDYCGGDCNTFCVQCLNVNGVRVPDKVRSYTGAGLAGALPATIGDLGPELDDFTLNDDGITGAVPDEIGLLTGLTTLDLSRNQITSIPTTIGDLANLELLYLSGNSIEAVPGEIGQLTSLKRLRLSYNDLTGVPVAFRTLDPTIDCELEGNMHSGFSCANTGAATSCCTADNCGDTATCYTA